jgi:adenylate cyclase
MLRPAKPLILGVLVAAAGAVASVAPRVAALEESLGLGLLFHLRGPRQPPPEVVVVGIDKRSADLLGVPGDPDRWSRALHARLTDSLAAQGAAVIVLDLVFAEPRPPDDEIFAAAMRRARRVVLGGYLVRETLEIPGETAGAELEIETLIPPHPAFADAALAAAPFPLPKVPKRVSQYWAFKPGAGDAPTLPAVAFQVFALEAYDALAAAFERVSPYLAEHLPADRQALVEQGHVQGVVRLARELLGHDPGAAERLGEHLQAASPTGLDARGRRLLDALVQLYTGPDTRYLNFYGPQGTIPIIPYHVALDPNRAAGAGVPRPAFAGRAVFVGMADPQAVQQKDGFYTVFSDSRGIDLSGTEIAATAFANLLDGTALTPPSLATQLGLVLLWGLGTGVLARLLPIYLGAPAVVAASVLYLLVAERQFTLHASWYPLIVPTLLQAPLAILGAVAWGHAEAHRDRRNFRRALGLYLPGDVADQVASEVPGRGTTARLVHGTCLSTDAHQYTALAETLSPAELGALMNRYYAAIFEPVRRHGGIVQDVVGDSMLAIWATTLPDAAVRERACGAALDIAVAARRFNEESGVALPTRIGLHSGQLLLGNVGAIDHFEYRAVGDIVNGASRLEGLNKHLGTSILATEEVLEGLDGLLTRCLGSFRVAGKSNALVVHELLARQTDATPTQRARCARFAEALAAYRARAWKEAQALFQALRESHEDDGPSRFYLRLCERHLADPPPEPWNGVVQMEAK